MGSKKLTQVVPGVAIWTRAFFMSRFQALQNNLYPSPLGNPNPNPFGSWTGIPSTPLPPTLYLYRMITNLLSFPFQQQNEHVLAVGKRFSLIWKGNIKAERSVIITGGGSEEWEVGTTQFFYRRFHSFWWRSTFCKSPGVSFILLYIGFPILAYPKSSNKPPTPNMPPPPRIILT